MITEVKLKEFLRTGKYGPVGLGMSSEEVKALLGFPDVVGETTGKRKRPAILKYGDWEFHFAPRQETGDRLVLIYMDDFGVPEGGSKVKLDPWIIEQGLPIGTAEREFQAAQLKFKRVQPAHLPGTTILSIENGASLSFREPEGNSHPPGLYAISFSGEEA